MTDKQLLTALQPLEQKMQYFAKTAQGMLTPDEVQLMKTLYPELQQRAMNQLPRVFTASCGSCIRETFTIFSSWYFRTKEKEDELLNDMLREKLKEQNSVEPEPIKKKGRPKK